MTATVPTPVGEAYSEPDTATLLGAHIEDLRDAASTFESSVLRVWDPATGEPVYPVWQFDSAKVHPVLYPLIRSWEGLSRWVAATWFTTPSEALGGETPLAWADRLTDEWSDESAERRRLLAASLRAVAAAHGARDTMGGDVRWVWVVRDHERVVGVYADEDAAWTDTHHLRASISGDGDTLASGINVASTPLLATPSLRASTSSTGDAALREVLSAAAASPTVHRTREQNPNHGTLTDEDLDAINDEFGLYSLGELWSRFGDAAVGAADACEIGAVTWRRREVYPGYQIDSVTDTPLIVIDRLLDLVRETTSNTRPDEDLHAWLTRPDPSLPSDKQRPVDWLQADPALVLRLAATRWRRFN